MMIHQHISTVPELMFRSRVCLIWTSVDIHSMFTLDCTSTCLRGCMNWHCEEPECSFQTLKERNLADCGNNHMITTTFLQYGQSGSLCISSGGFGYEDVVNNDCVSNIRLLTKHQYVIVCIVCIQNYLKDMSL